MSLTNASANSDHTWAPLPISSLALVWRLRSLSPCSPAFLPASPHSTPSIAGIPFLKGAYRPRRRQAGAHLRTQSSLLALAMRIMFTDVG
ncbi:hypothetical protein K466DRAFT_588902 [Polyporus arcularius HHB13444]|uniref:Uncharacterized protein n=1 Tax=Polyporus arcularius HHB13444 TaxID=1314778 RepID=A0A5C3P7C5_9APHY|nr:hypothetical protein K466DRAFT_588902 [Polyporus arcularius HHB13444]